MILVVNCECGNEIRTDSANAGKRGRCPHCRREFVVPAEGEMFPEHSRRASRPPAPAEPAPWLDNLAHELPPPARVSRPAEIPETASIDLAPIELEAKPEKNARCGACDGQFPARSLMVVGGKRLCPVCATAKKRERSIVAALPYLLVGAALVFFVGGLVWSARRAAEPVVVAEVNEGNGEKVKPANSRRPEVSKEADGGPSPPPTGPPPTPPAASDAAKPAPAPTPPAEPKPTTATAEPQAPASPPNSDPPPATDPQPKPNPEPEKEAATKPDPTPAPAPAAPPDPARDLRQFDGTWRGATSEELQFDFSIKDGKIISLVVAHRNAGKATVVGWGTNRKADWPIVVEGPGHSFHMSEVVEGRRTPDAVEVVRVPYRVVGNFESSEYAVGTLEVGPPEEKRVPLTWGARRFDGAAKILKAGDNDTSFRREGGPPPRPQPGEEAPRVARAENPPDMGPADGNEQRSSKAKDAGAGASAEGDPAADPDAKEPMAARKPVKKAAPPVPLSKRVDGDWFGQVEGGAPIRFRVEKGAVVSLSVGTAKYPGLDDVTEFHVPPGLKGNSWKIKAGQFYIEERKLYRAVQNGTPVRVETEFTIQGKFKDEKTAIGKLVIMQMAMIPGRSNVTLEPGQSWIADREIPANGETRE